MVEYNVQARDLGLAFCTGISLQKVANFLRKRKDTRRISDLARKRGRLLRVGILGALVESRVIIRLRRSPDTKISILKVN